MKQIIHNKYIKSFKFSSWSETKKFISNQVSKTHINIENTFGDNYYCYICYNSLTREPEFVLSFDSDEQEDNLNFLFWETHSIYVFDTGKNIYLVNRDLIVLNSFQITTPLIGFYLINTDRLLLLEEAFMRVIDYKGKVLRSELFDLIENFSINDDRLSIQTNAETRIFDLA